MKKLSKYFMICAAVMAAGLCLVFGPGAVHTQAQTGSGTGKTKVIYAENEDDFASETSKLAKKSQGQGLSAMSVGEVRPYSSARLIVRVKDGKKQSFTDFGADTVVTSGYGVSILQFSTPEKAKAAARKIASLSTVSYVEPDDCTLDLGDTQITEIEGSDAGKNSGTSSSKEGLSNPFGYDEDEDVTFAASVSTSAAGVSSGRMSWGAAYIQADQYAAYVKKTTKKTIKVAVVDSGVSSHRMLNGRRLAGKDFVDNDNDPTDKNGHGTHVAGTIVDCTPGLNVKILPVRVMNASGVGNPSVVGNGVRYAVKKGAKVINLSLGGYSHYKYLEECISYANRKGVTVVIAAGNGSYNTKRICPAHLSAPIVVTAINKNGKRAYFSNFGKSVDVAAPGVGIRSCWKNGGFATADGTSMAAPHISAAAAMYRLTHPSYSPAKIEKFIKNYAKDLGSKGNDKYYGRGVPRMKAAIPVTKKKKKKAAIDIEKPYVLSAMPASDIEIHLNEQSEETGECEGLAAGVSLRLKTIVKSAADTAAQVTQAASSGRGMREPARETDGQQATSSEERSAVASEDDAQADFFSSEVKEAGEKDTVKLYLYPCERPDNAVIRDGSIVAGDRLALDAEIIPRQDKEVLLSWSSSDPSIASVDDGGIVHALSEGTAEITASISGIKKEEAPAYPGLPGQNTAVPSGTGTFTVKVTSPSVMTRDASYKAGLDEEDVELHARVRVPGTLEGDGKIKSIKDDPLNVPVQYVMALFREDGDARTLLGAICLGPDKTGIPYGKSPSEAEDEGEPDPYGTDAAEAGKRSEDPASDWKPFSENLLSLAGCSVDGGKAALSLELNPDRIREQAKQEYAQGHNLEKTGDREKDTPEAVWQCRLAVYREADFSGFEQASDEKEQSAAEQAEAEAVCSCTFVLKIELPEEAEPQKAADAVNEENRQKPAEKGEDTEPDPSEKKTETDTDKGDNGQELPGSENTAEEAGSEETAEGAEPAATEEEPDADRQTNPEGKDRLETQDQNVDADEDTADHADGRSSAADDPADSEESDGAAVSGKGDPIGAGPVEGKPEKGQGLNAADSLPAPASSDNQKADTGIPD